MNRRAKLSDYSPLAFHPDESWMVSARMQAPRWNKTYPLFKNGSSEALAHLEVDFAHAGQLGANGLYVYGFAFDQGWEYAAQYYFMNHGVEGLPASVPQPYTPDLDLVQSVSYDHTTG